MVIVITYPGSPWLSECISSLVGCKYPIHIVVNPKDNCPYDSGAFYYAQEHGIKEFIPLHDSMVVKDLALFDKAFSLKGNVAFAEKFLMSFGKWDLSKIQPLHPKATDKKSALAFEEWTQKFQPDHIIEPLLKDTDIFTEKHGEKRMVLENQYIIKYKGTWDISMI